MRLRVLAALVPALAGCATLTGRDDAEEAPAALAAPWRPPADWAAMSAPDFEALVLGDLPEDGVTQLASATLHELAAALDRMDTTSVRAAVMLGRSRSPEAGEVIWERLERRELGPERNSDAGDVVAAAALARFPDAEQYWRLVRLVDGAQPHPDFEVRVECACTALAVGIDRVIPFLLKVLRVGTWDGEQDEWAYPVPPTTAWARGRAAMALSQRAGVAVTYNPDAPLKMRQYEARRLGEVLERVLAEEAEAAAEAR